MARFEKILLVILWLGLHSSQISCFDDDPTHFDVDKFIHDYISEVKRTLKLDSDEHTINKRSHSDIDFFQLKGIDLLVGFQEVFTLPVRYANDLLLFSQCSTELNNEYKLFAAALEVKSPKSLANYIILYEFQGASWVEVHRIEVLNGVRLAAEQIGDTIYIIVAEHHAEPDRGSTVFRVNVDTGTLQFEHTLRSTQQFPADVIIWKWEDMVTFAAVVNSENAAGSASRYATQSPVYRWHGSYFDMMQTLPTYNPRALTQFNIRSSMFIAVANFQNDNGETSVDSDIFRYNVATNKFMLYQKLPTEAAVDIKYFCFLGDHISESFLIYASAYHTDEEGEKHYNTASVVYKLSDEEYFVPFQAIRVNKITGWLPVRYSKNDKESLVLVGATEGGIVSYQYNGWRFVATGVHYDRSVFGPGLKNIRAFYYNNQTLISAANTRSGAYEHNVFSPVLKHHTLVGEVQQKVQAWEQQMSRQVADADARLTALLEIARAAPSLNDSCVLLGSQVIFQNVEIENVTTFKTKVGRSEQQTGHQLLYLEEQLDRLHLQLEGLHAKIGDITVHTRTIYDNEVVTSANIDCASPCEVQELTVSIVNGEDIREFLDDTVDVSRESVELDEITFENLAVQYTLDTRTINGHSINNVIDWSKEVVLDQGLQIDGTMILENNITVKGTVDGVRVNNILMEEDDKSLTDEVVLLPTQTVETLRASQLILSDGKLSQVDFREFNQSTLKTQGDQIFTEIQYFNKIEGDALMAEGGVNNTMPDSYLGEMKPCEGESCEEEDPGLLRARYSEADGDLDMESDNLIEDEFVIPYDIVYHGTIIIQNGTLSAKDFIDSTVNISAVNILEAGIPLNQSIIDNHFTFESPFKASNLTVDTVNGVNVSSLVDLGSPDPVVVRARKEFLGDLVLDGTVRLAGTGNLTRGAAAVEKPATIRLDNLTLYSINSGSVEVNGVDWSQIVKIRENGKVYLKTLEVEEDMSIQSMYVRGRINNFNLEELLQDTVYNDGKTYEITGKKHFLNELKISNLTVDTLNGIDLKNLSADLFWKQRLTKAKTVRVGNLSYTGKLEGIESRDFGEWLLSVGDQIVEGSQTIDTVQADHVTMSSSSLLNNINIHRLITEAVLITDNVTLDNVVFERPVRAAEVYVGGRLNGLTVPDDLVLSDTSSIQPVKADKHVLGSVTVSGDLQPVGALSSVSLPAYCNALSHSNTSLQILGNAIFKEEPHISDSVNDKKWTDLMDSAWFRDANVQIEAPVHMHTAQFKNLDVEVINNNHVEKTLSNLVSLSQDQIINGTFYFSNMTMLNGLEVMVGKVEGKVQGLHLQSIFEDVMLDGEDQEVWGYPYFSHLQVEGVLVSKGYVNNMNLSEDLMLTNVATNTMTSWLRVTNVTTDHLILPAGTLVGGVDLDLWNSSAVKTSADNAIFGNILFKGNFDSSTGIRVDGLVNGIRFDKDHLMLRNSSQQVTGVKTFSAQAKLDVERLHVKGYVNDINITEFYNQQVMNEGNVTLTGPTKFTSPLYCQSVSLPEEYQGYNLAWLETQLASPLPWDSYQRHLDQIHQMQQLAERSIAGRAYYLKKITRMKDIQGVVLYALPFQTENATLIAAIRKQNNKTTLSLLQWNPGYSLFLDKSGSIRNILNMVPSAFQSVVLPSGETAGYVTSVQSISGTAGRGELFRLKDARMVSQRVYGGQPGSRLLSFRDQSGRICFLVVKDMCSVYCHINNTQKAVLSPFPCHNISEATLLTTDNSVYFLGLQTAQSNFLVVWKLIGKRFTQVLKLPQFNPVSIAATTTSGPRVAIATRHRVGHTHPETIHIYRFNEEPLALQFEQSIPTISPKKVLFADLPSGESVMYVASDNPATPLEVFLYRGVLGYQWFAVDSTLPRPLDCHAVTDSHHRHFVIVTTEGSACVLQAQFHGDFTPFNT